MKTRPLRETDSALFETDVLSGNLKEKSLRGGLFTVICQVIDLGMRIASVAVLARILIPEFFGLISMVTAITAIAERFKDFGLSLATVQQRRISDDQINKLFWTNLMIGSGLMGFVAAAAPLIAAFFHEPRLIQITIAISSTFVWSGLTVQHQAILQRQMKLGLLGVIQISSTAISATAAVFLALGGYGYWALVGREVLRSVCITAGTWISCPWTPSRPRKGVKTDHLMRFGRDITVSNLVIYLTGYLDQVLIGKIWGPVPLAIYRQGQQLIFTPIMQLAASVSTVAEPTLSSLQDDTARYQRYYGKLVEALNFVVMPFSGFLAIYAHEVVAVVLGDKWLAAGDIFRTLAFAGIVWPASTTTGLLLVTCGLTTRYAKVGMLSGLILVLCFSIGVFWGGVGVAYGYLAATYLIFALRVLYSFAGTPVDANDFVHTFKRPLGATVAMMVLLSVGKWAFGVHGAFAMLAISAPVGVSVYLVAWIITPVGREQVKEIVCSLAQALRVARAFGA